MMHPKKHSRYPNPPPSLVIKPSAHNSPSRIQSTTNRLISSTSTPERMRVGQSLANQLYLGNTVRKEEDRDDLLTVSIQPSETHGARLQNRSQSMSLDSQTTNRESAESSTQHFSAANSWQTTEDHKRTRSKMVTSSNVTDPERAKGSLSPVPQMNGHIPNGPVTRDKPASKTILKSNSLDYKGYQPDPKSTEDSKKCNGITANHLESSRAKKSTLRQKFFDNYPNVLAMAYKTKKKVSFTLPSIERDESDLSISSHLSAVSDCVVLDDDEDE